MILKWDRANRCWATNLRKRTSRRRCKRPHFCCHTPGKTERSGSMDCHQASQSDPSPAKLATKPCRRHADRSDDDDCKCLQLSLRRMLPPMRNRYNGIQGSLLIKTTQVGDCPVLVMEGAVLLHVIVSIQRSLHQHPSSTGGILAKNFDPTLHCRLQTGSRARKIRFP